MDLPYNSTSRIWNKVIRQLRKNKKLPYHLFQVIIKVQFGRPASAMNDSGNV